jgi:hypothetical protein
MLAVAAVLAVLRCMALLLLLGNLLPTSSVFKLRAACGGTWCSSILLARLPRMIKAQQMHLACAMDWPLLHMVVLVCHLPEVLGHIVLSCFHFVAHAAACATDAPGIWLTLTICLTFD